MIRDASLLWLVTQPIHKQGTDRIKQKCQSRENWKKEKVGTKRPFSEINAAKKKLKPL